jgi:branched-chain amino acid aminotransferase
MPAGPPAGCRTIYFGPLIISTGSILCVKPAPSYTFAIYVSPEGYVSKCGKMTPVLLVEGRFTCSASGGTGAIKAIGNFAGPLLPQVRSSWSGT